MLQRISKAIQRFVLWLGPTRAQLFFVLFALTGLFSLILNAVPTKTSPAATLQIIKLVQSGLLVAFLVGAAAIVLSRVPRDERRQVLLIVGPALVAVSLGVIFSQWLLLFLPVAIAWVIIAPISMRGRIRREYQTAIKLMRKGEYEAAAKVMSELIKAEPDDADHRRFRAELYRLGGKVRRARADYERVIELTPKSAVGYNGLAEVYLQDGEFTEALGFAQKALELEPDQWVAPYNLGMIEDRLNMAPQAQQHLQRALDTGIPDSRHRLLTYLWMARSFYRQGAIPQAQEAVKSMKTEQVGLQEWGTIFESEEAAVLRDVLETDVQTARHIVEDNAALETLDTSAVSVRDGEQPV